jgi:hypothetical protein
MVQLYGTAWMHEWLAATQAVDEHHCSRNQFTQLPTNATLQCEWHAFTILNWDSRLNLLAIATAELGFAVTTMATTLLQAKMRLKVEPYALVLLIETIIAGWYMHAGVSRRFGRLA